MHTITAWFHSGSFFLSYVLVGLLGLGMGIGLLGGVTHRRVVDDRATCPPQGHDTESSTERRSQRETLYEEWQEYQVREQHRTHAE